MLEISSPILQEAKVFWHDHYNVETNWYAFWIPFSFWVGCWLYAKISKKDFGRWSELHALHHIGAITLASLSLYYDDDSVFNERNTILWSIPYFIIETLDTLLMGHFAYVLHGTICLVLGLANYNIPLLRLLRMNSKASYIETSSILLPYVKRHRKAWLFGVWAVIYTMCRIIWIPFMVKDLLNHGMEPSHPVFIGVSLFYCLNIYWYIKIIKIAIKGSGRNDENDGSKNKTKKE